MPVWRCPHCGTPQAESSRCWVCRRSTTSCGACRHYRRGIAVGLGVCGIDPRRPALHGIELRGCWEASDAERSGDWSGAPAAEPAMAARVAAMAAVGPSAGPAVRTFVPVETADQREEGWFAGVAVLDAAMDAAMDAARVPAPAPVTAAPAPRFRPRRIPGDWSLWGEIEA